MDGTKGNTNVSRCWKHRLLVALGLALSVLLVARFSPAGPDPVALKVQGPDTLGNPLFVQVSGQSNVGSIQTPISSSATGAASAITATLAGVPSKTTYITGFQITGGGATAASVIVVTVTGPLGGTFSYDIAVPAGATAATPNLIVSFPIPFPASAQNTNIVVNVPSFGAGNTNSAVVAQGFQQ